jgi:hypothetical protein
MKRRTCEHALKMQEIITRNLTNFHATIANDAEVGPRCLNSSFHKFSNLNFKYFIVIIG